MAAWYLNVVMVKNIFSTSDRYDIMDADIDVKRYQGIKRRKIMKRIKTLNTRNLKESMKKGGCGECQTSCQSACKTSCTVGNQSCENQ